jgi:hypothetical protein
MKGTDRFPAEPARLVDTNDPAGALLRESLGAYSTGLDGQRAWARAQARPPRARASWHVVALAAACAAALAFLVTERGQQTPVAAPPVTASAPVIEPLAAPVALETDEADSDEVKTRKHKAPRTLVVQARPQALAAGEEVALADGTRVRLAEESAAAVSAPESGRTVVALARGEVGVSVTKRRPGERFEVRAGRYAFRVVGTRFTVEIAGGAARLAVAEGIVVVTDGDLELGRFVAGETWSGSVAPPAPSAEGPPAAVEPARVEAPEVAPPPRAPAPTVEDVPARAPSPPAVRVPSSSECLGQSRAGASRQAAACLAAAATQRGLDAEIALVELARLRRDALGDTKGALAALSEYRARFPMGSLYEEALGASVDLLVRAGDGPGALAESERLLRRVGGAQRRAELRLLRGNVLRVLESDCRRADGEYAAAVSTGAERVADDAEFWRAVCLSTVGERDAAARAFTRYLERPRAQHAAEAKSRLEGPRR